MQIMTFHFQYIFSLILFTVKDKHLFTPNKRIHKYKSRNNIDLYLSTFNINKFLKEPSIWGPKALNHLHRHIKILTNDIKSFKTPLKRLWYHHSFYSIEEYYEYNDDKDMRILL
jgi:hypothetical protein